MAWARLIFRFMFALIVLGPTPVFAMSPLAHIDRPICFAITALGQPDTRPPVDSMQCTGEPTAYQDRSLWLEIPVRSRIADDQTQQLMRIYEGRFDRLLVLYSYADGHVVRQMVGSGHYGDHWRLGGQLLFLPPERDSPLTGVILRVDRLTSISLFRAHLLGVDRAMLESTIAAALVGGALSLLLLCAIYNFALAAAMQREYLLWHAAWATLLLLWGLIWSQAILIAIPSLAGTLAARICTFLACAAVCAATISTARSIEPACLPRPLRTASLGLALVVLGLGVPATLITGMWLDRVGDALSAAVVVDILVSATCIAWAWRKGSHVARDLAFAWAFPMFVLAVGEIVDIDDRFLGGGSQLAVLVASALQMVWLAMSSSLRLGRLRRDHERATAAEKQLTELARRDPLTGLLNRRGLLATIEEIRTQEADRCEMSGLLLVDIDHFKAVNDAFGHVAGDAVLRRIASILQRCESDRFLVARLGGEEFALGTWGPQLSQLDQIAEDLRYAIARCRHEELTTDTRVTVSIGMAVMPMTSGFQDLYKLADQALYVAKRNGRNQVVSMPDTDRLSPPPRQWDFALSRSAS